MAQHFRPGRSITRMMSAVLITLTGAGFVAAPCLAAAEPLRLAPQNEHYFLFRGRPTVLVGNTEHYAAVMNRDFDYIRYLNTLKAENLNVTRLFTGLYREPEESFAYGQAGNVLAPKAAAFLAPWPRSTQPGSADGLNKFDLERWSDAYFERLRSFIRAASDRGIIVEVVLFSNYYAESSWNFSPLNSRNNINGIGEVRLGDALSLKNLGLLAAQDALVRKLAEELRDFDNIYYEICNEPWLAAPYGEANAAIISSEWQTHIAQTLTAAEANFPARHLLAQEFFEKVVNVNRQTSIYFIRGTLDLRVVTEAYRLNKALGTNETGFRGISDAPYRIQAWEMFIAGGAAYVGLDYSFTVGHEEGSFTVPARQLGGGSSALRAQLGFLHSFLDSLDLVHMLPDQNIIESGVPDQATAYVLANPGVAYVLYIHHGHPIPPKADMRAPQYLVDHKNHHLQLTLRLPPAFYIAKWINTKKRRIEKTQEFEVSHGSTHVSSPVYSEDIALLISRKDNGS